MPAVNSMLGLFGLATRRQLETALDRKDRWHDLDALPAFAERSSRDTTIDDERELAGLRKDLRARESSVTTLRAKVEELEEQLHSRPDPDKALQARAGWLERELESRDNQVVRLQERIESLQDELDGAGEGGDESGELRQLRADLEVREYHLEIARAEMEEARTNTGLDVNLGDFGGNESDDGEYDEA